MYSMESNSFADAELNVETLASSLCLYVKRREKRDSSLRSSQVDMKNEHNSTEDNMVMNCTTSHLQNIFRSLYKDDEETIQKVWSSAIHYHIIFCWIIIHYSYLWIKSNSYFCWSSWLFSVLTFLSVLFHCLHYQLETSTITSLRYCSDNIFFLLKWISLFKHVSPCLFW